MSLTSLRRLRAGLRRSTSRSEPGDWRQVPRIDLLSAPGRRHRLARNAKAGLLLVLLAEAVLGFQLYSGLSSAQAEADKARQRLQALRLEDERLAGEVQDLHARLDQQRGHGSTTAQADLTAGHIDWVPPLASLFGAQVEGLSFDSVEIDTAAGEARIAAKAENVEAVVRFQAEVRLASRYLGIRQLSWEDADPALNLRATLNIDGGSLTP